MALHAHSYLTEAEYLHGEQFSDIKHEYIYGDVYAMAGASRNHERLSGNIFGALLSHLKDLRCEPFMSDIKVKADGHYFYPDVIVVCDDEQGDDYYTEKPVIIVEVLSKGTRRNDKSLKMHAYKTLPSLQEYVLIEQDFVDVEVCRRVNGWVSEHYFLGDEVTFTSLDLTLVVTDIYARVNNEDMSDYLQQLANEQGVIP
ncbi:MAG: Uma2 family endonuclease [Methylococcales bacterium]